MEGVRCQVSGKDEVSGVRTKRGFGCRVSGLEKKVSGVSVQVLGRIGE